MVYGRVAEYRYSISSERRKTHEVVTVIVSVLTSHSDLNLIKPSISSRFQEILGKELSLLQKVIGSSLEIRDEMRYKKIPPKSEARWRKTFTRSERERTPDPFLVTYLDPACHQKPPMPTHTYTHKHTHAKRLLT